MGDPDESSLPGDRPGQEGHGLVHHAAQGNHQRGAGRVQRLVHGTSQLSDRAPVSQLGLLHILTVYN